MRSLFTVTYAVLVLLTVCTVGLSCTLLLAQAVRNSPQQSWTRNFNALIIGTAYASVLVASLVLCVKRRVAVRLRLSRISKGYRAIGRAHVPNSVHDYITKEYARTCLVAYESEPKNAHHPGWGRQGTEYEGVRFRRALLDTITRTDAIARSVIPTLPPLKPHARMLQHFRYIMPLLPVDQESRRSYLEYYDASIQLARDLEREPTESEFEAGMAAAQIIQDSLMECEPEMSQDDLSSRRSYHS